MEIKYNWEGIDALLGHKTDREIADQFSIPRHNVATRRCRLGIPSIKRWSKFGHLLGTMTDTELAALIGDITTNAVTQKRYREGIPPYKTSAEKVLETQFLTLLPASAQRQVRTSTGIIDILTDESIYECKVTLAIRSAHTAIGQLLSASILYPNRELWIVCRQDKLRPEMQNVLKTLGISVKVMPQYDIWSNSK